MAAVSHLGLFPTGLRCPQPEVTADQSSSNERVDIWISSGTPFLYACAHYWKVKTWRVSLSATWKEGAQEGATTFSTSFSDTVSQGIQRTISDLPLNEFSEETEENLGETPSSENELVCGVTGNTLKVAHSLDRRKNVTSGGAGTSLSAFYSYGVSQSDPPAYFRLDGGGNVSHVNTNFRFTASTFRWVIRAFPFSGNTGEYGTLTYSLLGQSFSTPLYAANSFGSTTLNISVSIEAEEYWPYAS